MGRRQLRIRISPAGHLEIVDPGYDCADLLKAINPEFRIRCQALTYSSEPNFLRTRRTRVGYTLDCMHQMSTETLTNLHAQVLNGMLGADQGASLLDLKTEIAGRYMRSCVLCGNRCKVDRTRGERGTCGLGPKAIVAEHFVHVAEESPINPSLLLSLAGCGLRCSYCQQWELLDTRHISGPVLEPGLWRDLDIAGARSISFAGGNPDESLFAVLPFLRGAPDQWELPVVWNNHAYCSPETLELLEGIADVYLPDLKYGNNDCGWRWSGVHAYTNVARQAISQMLHQKVPVIVRVLVLPGHINCCHIPALQWLAGIANANLKVSIRGQYSPDWKISATDRPMSSRPELRDLEALRAEAFTLGLELLD